MPKNAYSQELQKNVRAVQSSYYSSCTWSEAGFLVRVHPEPCLILSRAQILALLCSSKSKFIPA
jgi:hypothetical protein